MKKVGNKKIGENMRKMRKERGMTQSQVGKVLDISFQQIQKYEDRKNKISAEALFELAHGFSVDINEFNGERPEPEVDPTTKKYLRKKSRLICIMGEVDGLPEEKREAFLNIVSNALDLTLGKKD